MKYVREPGSQKNVVLIDGIQIEIRERHMNGSVSYSFYCDKEYLGRSKGPLSLKRLEGVIERMHRIVLERQGNRQVMETLLKTGLSLAQIEYFAKSAHTSKLRREYEEAQA